MTPRELRPKVIEARDRFYRGEGSLDDLYLVVDQYIAAVTEHAKTLSPVLRRRFRPPTRAYLLRAL